MITLEDIRLSEYTLEHLPRLEELRRLSFVRKPEICIERARCITKYLKYRDDPTDSPELRQAKKVHHFLRRKAARFHDCNLLAGTTTSKALGAPLFPEFFALSLWPELETVSTREKNPQALSAEDARELNQLIFPFWMDRSVLEVARTRFDNPKCLKLFESLVFFIAGKAGCISHCVPTYTPMLEKGLVGVIDEATAREAEASQAGGGANSRQVQFYRAIKIALQGIIEYAGHLADEAAYQARIIDDPELKKEFADMAEVCRQVPAHPARSFREAVNAIWICQIGMHAENINMAMSPGRLDQVLYPYFRRDMDAGQLDIAGAMELIGCLWLKISDNVIMVPEASEEMFGGAGTVPAITLGGVDSQGEDAVNDLTYLMLRVTELLKIRDPNVNARYHYEKNSDDYRKRVAEVIINTRAVPAFFNDVANIKALCGQGETLAHARDYAVIGCVELASSGRDYPASSSIMLNLSAAMEMALYGGRRPITGETQVGPATAPAAQITSFEQFWEAFKQQLDWLIDQAVQTNEILGAVHQEMMPSPLLSAFFEGPMQNGRDLIQGGALYNSSGATHIGFADTVDSLSAIESAVFARKKVSFTELVQAMENDFSGADGEKLRLYLKNQTPKYGTEDPIARKNARNLVGHLFRTYQSRTNYRGGKYRPAYWTMTNHAGLGGISGAMPNGRKSGGLFASGITPVSGAAPELTACLNAVAELGGEQVPGCWALNIKYTPEDDVAAMSQRFAQTIEAYFRAGGQQVQFNIMDYAMLNDAKKHPENYPELMVRVSGYSAYFKDLNDLMKDELITRTQYGLTDGRAVPFNDD
ncbi:glycyl radical enzyme [Desulfosarcina ovata subsp. sediminis]|uniref:Glycyl radical enzyme n=1 Tax=Desulfosarcina ovata subsp. sediminis TaxID=885957 RepID=A0A5K7ZUD2_9BACT|nr:pyruvate formate lyase family protein [Desulfosarcina ovata]BBO83843.1 glycyl radical enzyme [Desulfosarcina ovata subsp. sediminis]